MVFKPGAEWNGNANGRPKRKTFRDYFNETDEADLIKRIKESLSEKEILKLAIEQVFGKARQNIEMDTTVRLPKPIDDVLPTNASIQEDKEFDEES